MYIVPSRWQISMFHQDICDKSDKLLNSIWWRWLFQLKVQKQIIHSKAQQSFSIYWHFQHWLDYLAKRSKNIKIYQLFQVRPNFSSKFIVVSMFFLQFCIWEGVMFVRKDVLSGGQKSIQNRTTVTVMIVMPCHNIMSHIHCTYG